MKAYFVVLHEADGHSDDVRQRYVEDGAGGLHQGAASVF
jgi:hypothetical protein